MEPVSSFHHIFLTRIPPRLPKEEVEAVLEGELTARNIKGARIAVIAQNCYKNKGFGFITLEGCPSEEDVARTARALDGLSIGGRSICVRPNSSTTATGLQPGTAQATLAPPAWDQPADKVGCLCARVLHCYYARRAHQTVFRAERLLALLSTTVAPSRGGEPKPLTLWGREAYGGLEAMLLSIGNDHFGGGWKLEGTIAERTCRVDIGVSRHMRGWDPLRDPLPVATILRLATTKSRFTGLADDDAADLSSNGSCTPTAGLSRRSDCGSLNEPANPSEQLSCSQSEASWSMRSLNTPLASGSDCCPALESSHSDTSSASPASVASFGSLLSCHGSSDSSNTSSAPHARQSLEDGEPPDGAGDAPQRQSSEPMPTPGSGGDSSAGGSSSSSSSKASAGAAAAAPGCAGNRLLGTAASRACGGQAHAQLQAQAQGQGQGQGHAQPQPQGQGQGHSACGQQGRRTWCGTEGGGGGSCSGPGQAGPGPHGWVAAMQHAPRRYHSVRAMWAVPLQPLYELPWQCAVAVPAMAVATVTAVAAPPCEVHVAVAPPPPPPPPPPPAAPCPPSAADLLFRCAQHLHLLFSWHPGQREFPVSYVRELLSSAPDVVAWGSGSPYFSLQGYSTAVYGSFEGLLLQVSRAHFGGCWRVERRQHGAGEEAVLAVRTYGRCASMGAASMGARVGGGGGGRGSGRWSQLSSRASSSKSLPVTAPATAEAEADGF